MIGLIIIMSKSSAILLPITQKILNELGENIHLARLRRDFSAVLIAQRAGISRNTLREIEHGSPNVKIGLYLNVLFCLGLHNDLKTVAQDDELGRKLQDIGMVTKKRARKKEL